MYIKRHTKLFGGTTFLRRRKEEGLGGTEGERGREGGSGRERKTCDGGGGRAGRRREQRKDREEEKKKWIGEKSDGRRGKIGRSACGGEEGGSGGVADEQRERDGRRTGERKLQGSG